MTDGQRDPRSESAREIKSEVPRSARVWNYWLGGADNYAVDHAAGDAVKAQYPQIVTVAKESREFLVRVVHTLAGELGVRQFLDIGSGLPTMQNTHQVAQTIAPESRVVYVDNDPLVLVHARALLADTTVTGVTEYVDADVRNPDLIISEARKVLNFNEPVAVIFLGILGYIADIGDIRFIVSTVMDAVPSGSYLVIRDNTPASESSREAAAVFARSGAAPYHLRSREQIAQFFEGLDMVPPGLVPVRLWRPDEAGVSAADLTGDHGGMARKP